MSISEVSNILKHDYKNMTDLLNNSVGLCAQLDKRTDSIVGDYAVIRMVAAVKGYPLILVMPESMSVERRRLMLAYGARFVLTPREKGMNGAISKAEMSAMSTDKGAFVRAQPRRMKNLYSACQRDYARQTWGDGGGAIATCGASGPSTTVALAATTSEQALVNLAEGMQVDIGTYATPTVAAADRTVLSVDFAAATMVVSGAAVTVGGCTRRFRQGSGGVQQNPASSPASSVASTMSRRCEPRPGERLELEGDGQRQRRRAASAVREPARAGRAPHHENRSGATVNELREGAGVFRAMVNNLKGRQRVVNDLALHGGHKAIDYTFGAESLPLSRDRDAVIASPNSLWGFEWSSMAVYVQDDWQWEDEDGTVLRLAGDRTHAFEALYYTFRELGWEQRNHNFRIDDLETA
jgi:hypothetical protein